MLFSHGVGRHDAQTVHVHMKPARTNQLCECVKLKLKFDLPVLTNIIKDYGMLFNYSVEFYFLLDWEWGWGVERGLWRLYLEKKSLKKYDTTGIFS